MMIYDSEYLRELLRKLDTNDQSLVIPPECIRKYDYPRLPNYFILVKSIEHIFKMVKETVRKTCINFLFFLSFY